MKPDLVLWAMLVCGLLYIATASALFSFVRMAVLKRSSFFAALCYCNSCLGFWLGAALVSFFPFHTGFVYYDIWLSAVCGLAMGTVWGRFVNDNHAIFQREFGIVFGESREVENGDQT